MINVFICDFFLEYGNNCFANYADNTNIRIVDENTKEVLTNLSALAKSNIRMACQQSNESEPWRMPSDFEYSREHLHSNRVHYNQIL